jgi:CelD/BcsL family acetyltransferase involved in cellulose biosynthesis
VKPISVRECTDLSKVGSPAAWNALTARPTASLSGSWAWVNAAFARLHPDALPYILAVDAAETLVGLLPLALHHPTISPTLRYAGAPHNDLTDMLVLPGYEVAAAEAFIASLDSIHKRGWTVQLNDIDPHGVLAAVGQDSHVLDWASDDPSPTIDLRGTWRSCASSRRTSQWERRLRRLREHHMVEFRRIRGPRVVNGLSEFFSLREARLQVKGRPLDLPPAAFVDEIVHAFAPAGTCAFMDMLIDGRPVARDLYLIEPPVAMMWLRGLDPNWQRFPCGHLLLRASASVFTADGYNVLDLGRGDEPYKYVFGADRRVLLQVRL